MLDEVREVVKAKIKASEIEQIRLASKEAFASKGPSGKALAIKEVIDTIGEREMTLDEEVIAVIQGVLDAIPGESTDLNRVLEVVVQSKRHGLAYINDLVNSKVSTG
jgi:DNA transposition AAA+ family ATPase